MLTLVMLPNPKIWIPQTSEANNGQPYRHDRRQTLGWLLAYPILDMAHIVPNLQHPSMWWKICELVTMAPQILLSFFNDVAPPHVLCLFFAVPCAPIEFYKSIIVGRTTTEPIKKERSTNTSTHPPTHR